LKIVEPRIIFGRTRLDHQGQRGPAKNQDARGLFLACYR
jgi:hypothetical protein